MISFTDAPAVPLNYKRLAPALSLEEREMALRFGYVTAEPMDLSRPAGDKSFDVEFTIDHGSLDDWRNRMFLVWFCFLFENIMELRRPLAAFEELLFEFQGGPTAFDENLEALAQAYAGVSAERHPLIRSEIEFLTPYYRNAVGLLEKL